WSVPSELNILYFVIWFPDRFNKNGIDLNRNFPDAFSKKESGMREMEVRAIMDWLKTESFVLSANLHGGAVVASYPYDNSNGVSCRVDPVFPDNDVLIQLAKTYSYTHSQMHKETTVHDSKDFKEGITNGYYWYPLPGGMQDYNYVWGQCPEITLELVLLWKFPPESDLPGLWDANQAALLAYMQQVHL
ncbi:carboxypeptidase M-like, partial [Oncorhynchus nerka]|uniref:carboxypeptidase M-like n=1 Tax=Oncorhynchus nerka TaxID=8023 RepID=UPI0031B87016